MAHSINGIITSFKYIGELPHVILVGNYHLIPFTNRYGANYVDKPIPPYEEFTKAIKKRIKDLSFHGKCAYIETDYFGGTGVQISETWEDGKKIDGPLISYDGIKNTQTGEQVKVVENAINQSLQNIGIYRHEDKDEFDSIGLGKYRSYNDILKEYEIQKKA